MSDTTYPHKAWTLLIFMAGDNDLESFGHLDLVEMEALPSDEQIHVVVQFDSRAEYTYRFRFYPGGYEMIGEPLGETNTGDPGTLTDFITWGKAHFPADQTALVIWNHGTGLRDLPADFDYDSIRSFGEEAEATQRELRRSLFTTTLQTLATALQEQRGVALDATNRDYLDTQELRRAIEDVPGDGPRVDLIGFDACLMSAVEIGYELRDLARYMVGSQETEPGGGWPYGEILTALAQDPTMSARQLAQTIVEAYSRLPAANTGPTSPYTQSALDLGQLAQTFRLMQMLAIALFDESLLQSPAIQDAFRTARQQVKRFHDRDLADWLDWCHLLTQATRSQTDAPFLAPLAALQTHLTPGQGLVVASHAHGGADAGRIHGASIYWPEVTFSPLYKDLAFAKSGWASLSEWVTLL